MRNHLPEAISEIVDEVQPGYWEPQSIEEYTKVRVSNAIINVWVEQQNSERRLRKRVAYWIFTLISFQIVALFSTLFLIGTDALTIDRSMIKVLLPSVLGEILGMGFIVVKYLFNSSAQNIGELIEKVRKTT